MKDWDVVRHLRTNRTGTIRGSVMGGMVYVAWDNWFGGMAYVVDLVVIRES